MKPIIGILSCGFMENRQFVTDSYVRAVQLSGGIPLVIPMLSPAGEVHTSTYLDICHGFLLPGGGDFTPLLFGEAPLSEIGETDTAFDVFQIRFAQSALKTKKPILGICRGMQVLNAACGGTIYQDLSLQPQKAHLHMQNSRNRSDASHLIIVRPESLLSGIIGMSAAVNSFHHQSIHVPGENVEISARAADHTPEAIEITGHPFALGVQWHPEAMFSTSPPMQNLFSVFIQKAGL